MSQKIICVPRVAAVCFQMAATFSTRALIFESGEIRGRGREHPGVEGELAAVGGDGQGVVLPRIDLLRAQPLVAFDQLLLEGVLARPTSGRRRRSACRLPASGRGRLSISAVCTSAKARNICWSSGRLMKRAKRLRGRKRRAVRARFPSCRRLRRRWRPRRRNARCRGSSAPRGRGSAAWCTSRPSCWKSACRWRRSRRGRDAARRR